VHGESDRDLRGSSGWNYKGEKGEQKQSGKLPDWHVRILATFNGAGWVWRG
jgi:hypothetical protein